MVKSDKTDFAYIKATEGGDWVDRKFQTNWKEARAANIIVGAYHFFTFCRPGLDQAKNFINTVPVDATALPPAVDLEYGGNCKTTKTNNEIVNELKAFLRLVEKHYRTKAILYVTPEFYQSFSGYKFLKEYRLWVRSIARPPSYGEENWEIWQFHNRGKKQGIQGPVDLNVAKGKSIFKMREPGAFP